MNPHCGSLPCGPVQKKCNCDAFPHGAVLSHPTVLVHHHVMQCSAQQTRHNGSLPYCAIVKKKKLSFRWTTILCSAKKATQCGSAQCGAVVNNPFIVVYFHVVHYHIVQCCTTLPLLYRAVQWDTVECVFCMNSELQ